MLAFPILSEVHQHTIELTVSTGKVVETQQDSSSAEITNSSTAPVNTTVHHLMNDATAKQRMAQLGSVLNRKLFEQVLHCVWPADAFWAHCKRKSDKPCGYRSRALLFDPNAGPRQEPRGIFVLANTFMDQRLFQPVI